MTKAITPSELAKRGQYETFSLVDVREKEEHEEERIKNSSLIPLSSFLADPTLAKPDQPVVFICRSGRRSEVALKAFIAKFPDATAYNLTGGLLAWKAASLPTESKMTWTFENIYALYQLPLMELVYKAATVHRQHFDPLEVQRCSLLSIKTGGCPENCSYCPQSAHYQTG